MSVAQGKADVLRAKVFPRIVDTGAQQAGCQPWHGLYGPRKIHIHVLMVADDLLYKRCLCGTERAVIRTATASNKGNLQIRLYHSDVNQSLLKIRYRRERQ
ncbi:hypothetical protein D3C81_1978970 [compost metagenome]